MGKKSLIITIILFCCTACAKTATPSSQFQPKPQFLTLDEGPSDLIPVEEMWACADIVSTFPEFKMYDAYTYRETNGKVDVYVVGLQNYRQDTNGNLYCSVYIEGRNSYVTMPMELFRINIETMEIFWESVLGGDILTLEEWRNSEYYDELMLKFEEQK